MNLVMISGAAQIIGITTQALEDLIKLGKVTPIDCEAKSHRKFDIETLQKNAQELRKFSHNTDNLATSEDAASICGVSYATFRRWVLAGKVLATRIGKKDYFDMRSLPSAMKAQREQGIENVVHSEKLVDSRAAAKICGVTYQTIRSWVKRGKLLAVKLGQRDFFNIATLDMMQKSRKVLVESIEVVQNRVVALDRESTVKKLIPAYVDNYVIKELQVLQDELFVGDAFNFLKSNISDIRTLVKDHVNKLMDRILV